MIAIQDLEENFVRKILMNANHSPVGMEACVLMALLAMIVSVLRSGQVSCLCNGTSFRQKMVVITIR